MAGQANAPLPEGLEICGYRIVKKIAVGGFSIVYQAEDEKDNIVAIKEYLPGTLARRPEGEHRPYIAPEHMALYRIGLKYFFDEGRVLASIHHPNIVSVLNFFRANETVYMVMAYEEGYSLHDYIEQQRKKKSQAPVSEAVIRQIFIQIMDALREVHAKKLLHLDLKPANIYLRNDGTPILLDFGAARRTLQADLSQLHPMYTPGFAAPELHTKKDLGPWTDIYSLGAAMFNCMTGYVPQAANERKKHDRMEENYQSCLGAYSSLMIKLTRWSLMLDPLQRPQSVFNLQNALRQTISHEQTLQAPQKFLSQLKRWMGSA